MRLQPSFEKPPKTITFKKLPFYRVNMGLKLFNTLTREKEALKPLSEKVIKIYTCGPNGIRENRIPGMPYTITLT